MSIAVEFEGIVTVKMSEIAVVKKVLDVTVPRSLEVKT